MNIASVIAVVDKDLIEWMVCLSIVYGGSRIYHIFMNHDMTRRKLSIFFPAVVMSFIAFRIRLAFLQKESIVTIYGIYFFLGTISVEFASRINTSALATVLLRLITVGMEKYIKAATGIDVNKPDERSDEDEKNQKNNNTVHLPRSESNEKEDSEGRNRDSERERNVNP